MRKCFLILFLAAALSFAACSEDTFSGVSCDEDSDCEPGAECIDEFCVATVDGDAGVDTVPEPDTDPVCEVDGEVLCGSDCVDLSSDDAHCGQCNNACSGELTCIDNQCGCDAGQTACGTTCHNTEADPDACGDCETTCEDDEVCSLGSCESDCAEGLEGCSGACVDWDTDIEHCGECGEECEAPDNATAECDDGDCGYSCDDGFAECDGECVDFETNADHCGGCTDEQESFACDAPAEADPLCEGSQCDFSCVQGFERCGEICVDLNSNVDHCGSCDAECPEPDNGSVECTSDGCEISCETNFEVCAGECVPTGSTMQACGEECVDVETSTDHCGECDNDCAPGQSCDGTQCIDCDDHEDCTEATASYCSSNNECVECIEAEHCGDPEFYDCQDDECICEDERSHDLICDEAGVDCGTATDACGNEGIDCDRCEGTENVCADDIEMCVECVDDGDCGDPDLYNCESHECQTDASAIICDGEEVDLETDSNHCGACHNECGDGTTGDCVDGHCESDEECDETVTDDFGNGEGTSDNPNLICNPDQFLLLSGSTSELDSHFLVTADIDLDGAEFNPIGDGSAFEGVFDGNHHEISDFTINLANDVSGLFSEVDGTVRNVRLRDVDGGDGDDDELGILAGRNHGLIENVSVHGTLSGAEEIGGMVGHNTGEIRSSSAHVELLTDDAEYVGGLVGLAEGNSPLVIDSYATGVVEGSDHVGGLIGSMNANATVESSYSIGLVSGEDNIGGLIGSGNGTVTDSYWWFDEQENDSQVDVSAGGEPLDTTQFGSQSSFEEWDFTETWKMSPAQSAPVETRPILHWEIAE